MPIYEYRCEACDHELEAIQKMSDPALSECPECKQDTLKKIISAAAFRLKGSGWYETDFKHGGKKNIHDSGASEGKSASTEKKASSCGGGSCGCH
ncbi:MAG: zinc ribbon domain-containing protein [Candidatus Thiodiazotropha sp.]